MYTIFQTVADGFQSVVDGFRRLQKQVKSNRMLICDKTSELRIHKSVSSPGAGTQSEPRLRLGSDWVPAPGSDTDL